MQFRNIIISNAKELSIKNNQLLIDRDNGISFPLEDINSIVIENQATNLSAYALSAIAENEIALYLCDERHLPSAVVLPILKHSRHYKMLKSQISVSKPFQKQLWQMIITQKIRNQAACLKMYNKKGWDVLEKMALDVRSGDSTYMESRAAAYYFKMLFGDRFSRNDDSIANSALNYGYSIIRGMIARSLVTYGYEPSIGIWHKNELNSYNLADDFIEPFRPFVDAYIYEYIDLDRLVLEPGDKRTILRMLGYEMKTGSENRVIKNCIDLVISSFTTAFAENVANKLVVPELCELREHRYE